MGLFDFIKPKAQASMASGGFSLGGFDGGLSSRRLKGFTASRAHVNSLIAAAGNDLTARARYLIRNNGYASNALESFAGNAVGTGITPSDRKSVV